MGIDPTIKNRITVDPLKFKKSIYNTSTPSSYTETLRRDTSINPRALAVGSRSTIVPALMNQFKVNPEPKPAAIPIPPPAPIVDPGYNPWYWSQQVPYSASLTVTNPQPNVSYVWQTDSPAYTGLYLDSGLTVPYTGENTQTLYWDLSNWNYAPPSYTTQPYYLEVLAADLSTGLTSSYNLNVTSDLLGYQNIFTINGQQTDICITAGEPVVLAITSSGGNMPYLTKYEDITNTTLLAEFYTGSYSSITVYPTSTVTYKLTAFDLSGNANVGVYTALIL